MDGPTGGDASERSLGQVEGGIFGCGEWRGRIWRASGEYSPVDGNGPGRPRGRVEAEDAGSGQKRLLSANGTRLLRLWRLALRDGGSRRVLAEARRIDGLVSETGERRRKGVVG